MADYWVNVVLSLEGFVTTHPMKRGYGGFVMPRKWVYTVVYLPRFAVSQWPANSAGCAGSAHPGAWLYSVIDFN